MISRVSKALKTDLVKVSFFSSISTLVRMLTGFVSVKVVASLIGPSGVALTGQLNSFSSIIMVIATGGIISGVTKYVSEFKDDESEVRRFLQTAAFMIGIMAVLCGIFMLIFADKLALSFLHTTDLSIVFRMFGLTIILYSANSFLVAVLNGYKEFRRYNLLNISEAFIGLIFSIVLATLYGVKGALVGAITYQSVVFLVTIILVRKCYWYRLQNFIGQFDIVIFKKYLHFSLMAVIFACVTPVAQLMVRNNIISSVSLSEAGIWEGMNRISNMYLMVITSSLSVYYLPRLSEIKDDKELRNEIFQAFKIILPLLLLATICIFFFRHLIIQILFTNEFSTMEHLFMPQLIGDFFKIASWLIAFQMVAKSMTKTFIVTEIVGSASFLGLSTILVLAFGVVGASWGYAVNYILYFFTMVIIFRKVLFYVH